MVKDAKVLGHLRQDEDARFQIVRALYGPVRVAPEQVVEYEPHRFAIEASDLGLMVGNFPQTLLTDLGNGRSLLFARYEVKDGELLWVDYEQELGCISLRVFND